MAYKATNSPYYKGNEYLPKAGTIKELTPDQIDELAKCIVDPIYFAETYFKIVHQDAEDGVIALKLFPYQREAIEKFKDNNRLLMATARQIGKALTSDTKIPLYQGGFTTMGQLKVGDVIIGSNGQPTTVTFKTPETKLSLFRVTFEDGKTIDACDDHLWTVTNRINHRKLETKNTARLAQDFRKKNSRGYYEYRYCVDNIKPVKYSSRKQSIDPYMLGAWLGGGVSASSGFTCHKDEKHFFEQQGIHFTTALSYERNSNPNVFTSSIVDLSPLLRKAKLLDNKHIPDDYLYGSVEQRLALLQGLMDTDGHIRNNGMCEIQLSAKNMLLIININHLLLSLGIKTFVKRFENDNFKQSAPSIRISFMPPCDLKVFRMPRKLARQKTDRPNTSYTNSRSIINIERIEDGVGHCIQVDAPDHLFAVTDKYILTHNTTVATVIILWIALFNKRKNIALLADKQETATEILERVKLAYEYLPEFLKGGVKKWDAKTVIFENGSKVFASATGSAAIRGKSIYLLYIDEAAHVEDWDNFAAAVLPTVTAAKTSKIIYTSTPNGMNHFFDYYEASRKGVEGSFPLVEVPWWKVEGRDEKWKQATLADMNFNMQKFAQEQEVEFLGSSGTLISGASLKLLIEGIERPLQSSNGLSMYRVVRKGHVYVIICDVSRGKLLDYSAFHVIDISTTPFEQVCVYYNNEVAAPDYAGVIDRISRHYNDASVLVENNDNGGAVLDMLNMIYENENLLMTETSGSGRQISNKNTAEWGIRTTKPVKAVGCAMIKTIVEQRQLRIFDKDTVEELKTFSAKGTSYEAEEGKHDDLCMGLVLFGWLSKQAYFKMLTDTDVLKSLRETTDESLDDYLLPFGIIDNGLERIEDTFEPNFEVSDTQFNTWMRN